METQKIVNLSNDSEELNSKFATRKWYIINDQNNGQYGTGDENGATIKFQTKVIKSNLCDYSDEYIFVTRNITVTGGDVNTNVAFKNCSVFTRSVTHINDEHLQAVENLDIIIPMYNLLEYSDNYADFSGSLWQFKRDEQDITAAVIPNDVITITSTSLNTNQVF